MSGVQEVSMTQIKIDIDRAEAPEIIRALAEQPCGHTWGPSMHPGAVPMPELDKLHPHPKYCDCQGLSLANPWASEACSGGLGCLDCVAKPEPLVHDALIYARGHVCNGSGRVPKAVGLSLIIVESQKLGCYQEVADVVTKQVCSRWSSEEEILLGALRAMAQAQGL